MADAHDPTDHFRTTHQHAGESFIDTYCWPGLLSIALGVMALIGCVASAAYQRHDWVPTTGLVGILAIAGGIAWLVIEHHRVLRIERLWQAEHTEVHRGVHRGLPG
ncbi:protein UsfY [Mycolicibacterium sp.]|uniref:protein UsfY n=1 Tax=Mycolicibacterium sp. TaxID=2320850 RepID=UPI003D147C0B